MLALEHSSSCFHYSSAAGLQLQQYEAFDEKEMADENHMAMLDQPHQGSGEIADEQARWSDHCSCFVWEGSFLVLGPVEDLYRRLVVVEGIVADKDCS